MSTAAEIRKCPVCGTRIVRAPALLTGLLSCPMCHTTDAAAQFPLVDALDTRVGDAARGTMTVEELQRHANAIGFVVIRKPDDTQVKRLAGLARLEWLAAHNSDPDGVNDRWPHVVRKVLFGVGFR